MEELFTKPENFNVVPLQTWDAESKSPGMFIPAYQPPLNEYGYIIGADLVRDEDDMTIVEIFKQAKVEGKHVMILKGRYRKVIPPHEPGHLQYTL